MSNYPCRIATDKARRKGQPALTGKQVANLIKCVLYDPPDLEALNPKWKHLNIDVVFDPVAWNDQISVVEMTASVYRFGFFMVRGSINTISQCCSCLTPNGAWYDLEASWGRLPDSPIAFLTPLEIERLGQLLRINKSFRHYVRPTWSVMVFNGVHQEFVHRGYDKGPTKTGKTFPKELQISPHFFDEESASKVREKFEAYFREKSGEPETKKKK